MNQTVLDHLIVLPSDRSGVHTLDRFDPHAVQVVVLPAATDGVAVMLDRHQPTDRVTSLTPEDLRCATWEDAEWQ